MVPTICRYAIITPVTIKRFYGCMLGFNIIAIKLAKQIKRWQNGRFIFFKILVSKVRSHPFIGKIVGIFSPGQGIKKIMA